MLGTKYNVSIKDYFQLKKKKEKLHDPSTDFSIIPSWNKEFVRLIGLEEVVQFRLDWPHTKNLHTATNKHKTKGRPKKFPISAVAVPATLPKDPYTCAKCNTDVSHSWKRDVNSSILCHSCFKCIWRKDHWLPSGPKETIKPSTNSFRSVLNEPMKEDAFFDPDSPVYCSSSRSSDLSFSPPGFYSDTTSNWSSSCPSDDEDSCIYIS
ncbi:transcriptional repressor p66-alpha isoform X4 [Silurus meridionalis]|nr:transcriptional repressor p66-alpha isoform X4 [Silurus meridionalis]